MVVFADSSDSTASADGSPASNSASDPVADGADSAPARRGRLDDLPPSAKFVYAALAAESPLTQSAIARRTRLSKRTTRHALSKLTDAAVVDERVSLRDARKRLYEPRPIGDCEGANAGESTTDADAPAVGPVASIATGD
ncbi:MAG: winged helix-turn-helix domain-containing protein [Halobacteriaceae archaeon]